VVFCRRKETDTDGYRPPAVERAMKTQEVILKAIAREIT